MEVIETAIPEVKALRPKRFGDARGYFIETYSQKALEAVGIIATFVQDNQSFSAVQGTIRGLHFQAPPHAQDKLVRVTRGSILDVAVDIRVGSPTEGRYVAEVLSAENQLQLFVPVGFAHGFCTLEPEVEVIYKVSDFYAPECEQGIGWDDPDLAIDWRLGSATATLSDKDLTYPHYRELPKLMIYEDRAST